ncbi:MAG: radical SAM family heme chaperone HemW [Bacteroidales bacterium]|jgi:oxygen-independent coproporphyrinogen-3 oxidase|nr:radical SAM family heme chaperone HemW [Bacteroidales bacterium]
MAGIYIHFPFCNSKCIYCNFYSVVNSKEIDNYLSALTKEITSHQVLQNKLPIETLYFGGGTPSLISPKKFIPIIDAIDKTFGLQNLQEFTFEANPEQLSLDYLFQLKRMGVNRLSIGVQSFDDNILSFMNRKHSAIQAIKAIENAVNADFTNISIDLIYGIAERDRKKWGKELLTSFSFPITHLSAYALTVEENTILYKKIKSKKIHSISENKAIDDYHLLIQIAQQQQFEHYEISNFSKKGFHSKHNTAYWHNIPYYGFGAAAHSYFGKIRQWNIANLTSYMKGVKDDNLAAEKESLTDNDIFNEYLLLGLRTKSGIDLKYIEKKYNIQRVERILQTINKCSKTLFQITDNRLTLSEEGFLWADYFAQQLFI